MGEKPYCKFRRARDSGVQSFRVLSSRPVVVLMSVGGSDDTKGSRRGSLADCEKPGDCPLVYKRF